MQIASINEATRSLLDGGLEGHTVLDMACNHGYFALEAARLLR